MNITKLLEKGKYRHKCLNCKTNFCDSKIHRFCPFCESCAIVIFKPEVEE